MRHRDVGSWTDSPSTKKAVWPLTCWLCHCWVELFVSQAAATGLEDLPAESRHSTAPVDLSWCWMRTRVEDATGWRALALPVLVAGAEEDEEEETGTVDHPSDVRSPLQLSHGINRTFCGLPAPPLEARTALREESSSSFIGR